MRTSGLCLDGGGDTGDQPAAADGYDHHVHIRNLLQQFQAQGALAGYDILVVEGVYQCVIVLLL